MNTNEECVNISDYEDLKYLIHRIKNGPLVGESFKFDDRELFLKLLKHLNINYNDFEKGYFHFDKSRNLHISESSFGYVWISTYGLICKGKTTNNKRINACINQYTVIKLLFEKAIEISNSNSIYDIDGYNFGYLSELTPALFHNVLFYIEVFMKAYLSFCEVDFPYNHKLSSIFHIVKDTMYKKNHNDSLFHAYIIAELEEVIKYVTSISGKFKEHYIKYDDNIEDRTVIIYDNDKLERVKMILSMSYDFIINTYYSPSILDGMYLEQGLFNKLLEKTKNKEEIKKKYKFLISPEN